MMAAAKKKPQVEEWIWMQSMADKDKWSTHRIPDDESTAGYIKRSSKNADGSHTFWIYRDGKYLDCCNDLEEAKRIWATGKMRPERILSIAAVRTYIKDTPGDIDAFKKLDKNQQQAVRDAYPHLAPRSSTLHLDRTGKGGGSSAAKRDMVAGSDKKGIGLPLDSKIERVKDGNPKKAGSDAHARWEFLFQHAGKKVADYVAAKGNPTTLKNAVKQGYIKVEGM